MYIHKMKPNPDPITPLAIKLSLNFLGTNTNITILAITAPMMPVAREIDPLQMPKSLER